MPARCVAFGASAQMFISAANLLQMSLWQAARQAQHIKTNQQPTYHSECRQKCCMRHDSRLLARGCEFAACLYVCNGPYGIH